MSHRQEDFDFSPENLSGSLLLAHPSMQDPNFHRTVILLSACGTEEGALGVVLNRPVGKTLGEVNGEYAYSPLAEVPLYVGGPVNQEQMLLAAWHWDTNAGSFKLFFGISQDQALAFMSDNPDIQVRAFLGYSGWSDGQLESELEANAWVVTPVAEEAVVHDGGEEIWRSLLTRIRPELLFLANQPDDPSLN